MGFQTPLYELKEYLDWTTSGQDPAARFPARLQVGGRADPPLLVTVLRGHPLGVVMLLKTGNDQVRFKPKPIEGVKLGTGTEPEMLLLDGQQRLTSLTQALSGDGVVATMDDRGKKLEPQLLRRHRDRARGRGPDRRRRALAARRRRRCGRTSARTSSSTSRPRRRSSSTATSRSAFCSRPRRSSWLFELPDNEQAKEFNAKVIQPTGTYNIPAIELDTETSKSAVATVFEKVNTGGLALNVFELLTATFAGDKELLRRARHRLPPQRRLAGDARALLRPPGTRPISRAPTSSRR